LIIGIVFPKLSLKTFKIKNYVQIQDLTFKMPMELAMSFKGYSCFSNCSIIYAWELMHMDIRMASLNGEIVEMV